MNCQEAREAFVERLTGRVDAERSSEIDRHLAGCAECRAETDRLRDVWTELGQLGVPAGTGAGSRLGQLIAARSRGNAGVGGFRASRGRRLLTLGSMVAASLLMGVVVGRGLLTRPRAEPPAGSVPSTAGDARGAGAATSVPNAASSGRRDQYVLLLHGPARRPAVTAAQAAADSATEASLIAEYRVWAMGLRDSGALLLGAKLADAPLTILTSGTSRDLSPNTDDALGGFFLIQADSAEAFRIARDCPHLRHGGTVEVRRIQPT